MSPRLDLHLLGSPQFRLGDVPIQFRYDKLRALLAYLTVESGRAHSRDALAGLLWPDTPDRDARRNLNQALFNLRQALREDAEPVFLVVSRDAIQFNPASPHTLDVAEFQSQLAACDRHRHLAQTVCAECADRLRAAAALYRGEFLQQFYLESSTGFEEWVLLRRSELHRQVLTALAQLAVFDEAKGDLAAARQSVQRQLTLEPWREEAHRDLMRLLALAGERSAALAQFEHCRKTLADELGVEPAAETLALYEQIRTGQSQANNQRVSPTAAGHLPAPLTPFLGRAQELATLKRLLADPNCRLLTLTGPGGIGKTRLAVQAATQQRPRSRDGAVFVGLAALGSRETIITAIADALGCVLYLADDRAAQLIQYLRDREILLILDNFEHLLDDPHCVSLVTDLLASSPGLRLIVTSREPLNLQGEWVLPVDGLGAEAVALFQQSARRVQASFELRPEDRPAVARLCELVEYLPLAVELTAAWVRVLTCEEIVDEIEAAFANERAHELFATTARDVPERHRTMAAVFDHSWRLLSPAEQQVLRRLAVFRGGFTREAAEQVAGATLSTLAALVSKSLLRRAAAGRYDLHELVRQYALAQLLPDAAATAETQQRHSEYYTTLLERRGAQLKGPERTAVVTELVAELDNVRSSWQWAGAHQRAESLSRAADTLFWLYESRSNCREGVPLFNQAATSLPAVPALQPAQPRLALGQLLSYQGYFCFRQGQHAQGRDLLQRSLGLLRPLADAGAPSATAAQATTAAFLGAVLHPMGEYAEGQHLLREALAVMQQLGDTWGAAFCLRELGLADYAQGNLNAAYDQLSQSLTLSRTMGNLWATAVALNHLGTAAYALGAYAEAQQLQLEALTLSRQLEDRYNIAYALRGLGRISQALNDHAAARGYFEESLSLSREIGDLGSVAQSLTHLGQTQLALGELPAAQRAFGEALTLAQAAHAIPIILEALVGEAQRRVLAGDPTALELLAPVLTHSAATQATRESAARLWSSLGGQPPEQAPTTGSLDHLLANVLAHSPPRPAEAA